MAPAILVVVHVLAVFWLVAGILGRLVVLRQAGRARDLASLRACAAVGHVFEVAFVRAGTFVVLLTGLAAAWARGWPILGFLQGGSANWVLAALVLYLSIVPVIVLVFVPRGRLFQAALAEAEVRGEVTAALRAAILDPVVALGRLYELGMVAVLAWLMVAKPF